MQNARVIVLWGKNPAETNIHQMVFIEKALQQGAKLIVVDPRRTPSTINANLHLQPIPGTDAALALAVAKILTDNNQVDYDFIQKHVLGFDGFREMLNQLDLNLLSQECGVPIHLIKNFAEYFGAGLALTLIPGYGMQRFSNGGQTIRCLLALSVITGNIGKTGACWHYADLQSDVFSTVKEPESYFPPQKKDRIFRRKISTSLLGETLLELKNPEIKMAWIERGNPMSQNPDSNLIRKALAKMDFVVVVEQFMTDTALEADIVLPAKSMFEQTDIVTSYWNPYIQLKPKILSPPKEVKPETEIYYLLAQKLVFSPEEIAKNKIPEPTDEAIEKWLDNKLSNFDWLSVDILKKGTVTPPDLQEIAFADFIFPTPSGKIELLSAQAERNWNVSKLPTYTKTKVDLLKKKNESLCFLLTPNTKNRIHSQFGNLNLIKSQTKEPYVVISSTEAQKLNIRTDDKVRISNERGKIQLKAKIDNSLRPGCVVICNGYWHQEGACPNSLSKGQETDMAYGAAFHDCLVRIEK